MCGRIVQAFTLQELQTRYKATPVENLSLSLHYNFPPKTETEIPIVIGENGRVVIRGALWGLLPSSARDTKLRLQYETFNAKSETLTASKVFSTSVLENQFCLVPVNGYFEWYSKIKPSQPFFIHRTDNQMMSLVGLWAKWVSHDLAQTIYSFTIVTAEAQGVLNQVHTRMPLIIDPQHELELLNPDLSYGEKLKSLFKENSPQLLSMNELEVHAVDRNLVSYGKDEEGCIKKLEEVSLASLSMAASEKKPVAQQLSLLGD